MKGSQCSKNKSRLKRKVRIRKKISGTPERPRLNVFRSARHMYAQLIDDTCGKTIVSASTLDKDLKAKFESVEVEAGAKTKEAIAVGMLVAERALGKEIKQVVFDRNGFIYHGRVKALSDGARKAGLEF